MHAARILLGTADELNGDLAKLRKPASLATEQRVLTMAILTVATLAMETLAMAMLTTAMLTMAMLTMAMLTMAIYLLWPPSSGCSPRRETTPYFCTSQYLVLGKLAPLTFGRPALTALSALDRPRCSRRCVTTAKRRARRWGRAARRTSPPWAGRSPRGGGGWRCSSAARRSGCSPPSRTACRPPPAAARRPDAPCLRPCSLRRKRPQVHFSSSVALCRTLPSVPAAYLPHYFALYTRWRLEANSSRARCMRVAIRRKAEAAARRLGRAVTVVHGGKVT